VVELKPGCGVLVEKNTLCSVDYFCKSARGVARALLAAVFTPQAPVTCSVKATDLKQAPEIGLDTEREMKAWDPQEKKAFRTGAQAFYIGTAKHLVKQLPLDNKLLLHLRFLDPSSHLTTEERVVIEVVELKPGCGVFVEKNTLCSMDHFCKSATSVARALLPAVFTPQAPVTCSVKAYTKPFAAKKGLEYNEENGPAVDWYEAE
ncbi:hypothetical protein MTO96_045241, partial [Rhipicephalus appendiculatus]